MRIASLFSLLAALALTGCAVLMPMRGPVRHIDTWTGFSVPECVLVEAKSGAIYISNIVTEDAQYWEDDGAAFITRVSPKGKRAVRWTASSKRAPIHAPKGMCVRKSYLYFTDNSRLMACDAVTGATVRVMAKGFTKANDLATDGRAVWLSDTAEGKVWRIAGKEKREIPAPPGVNGLACAGDDLYAVSWTEHEIYQLDPAGEAPPQAFGLAAHFSNLDSIEVLEDGSFIVSDFTGNTLYHVGADRSTVTAIVEVTTPADIGIDRKRRLLYVPCLEANRVEVYKLGLP